LTELDSWIKPKRTLVTIINELDTDNGTFIKARNDFTKKIAVSTRDCLSSISFHVIMSDIIKQVKGGEMKTVYSADAVTMFEDEDNLQR